MTTDGEDIGDDHLEPNALAEAIIVGAIPGSFIFAATLIALWFDLSVNWRCRLQNLSAGILLSAIFTELYPLIEHVLGLDGHGHYFVLLSMFVGFLGAFLIMVLIDYLPAAEDDTLSPFDYAYGSLEASYLVKNLGSHCLAASAYVAETMARGDHNWKSFCITKDNSTMAEHDLKQVLRIIGDFENGIKQPEVNRDSTERYCQALESGLAKFRNTITNRPPSISLTKQRIILEDLRKIRKAAQAVQRDISKSKHHERYQSSTTSVFPDLFKQISAATANIHWEMEHADVHIAMPASPATKHVIATRNTLDFDGIRPPGCPSSAGTFSEMMATMSPGGKCMGSIADDTSSAKLFKGLPTVPSAANFVFGNTSPVTPQDDTKGLEKARMLSPTASPQRPPKNKRNTRLIFGTLIQVFVCGFLIGLSYTVSARAGYIVSCASTLEMFLMGMAYSHSHQHSSRLVSGGRGWTIFLGLFMAPPFTLILATIIGSGLAAAMTLEEYMFHGFMTFGICSLSLHMVRTLFLSHVQALKNKMDGSAGWGGLSFLGSFLPFIGVYATWALSKVVPDDENNTG